VSSLLGEGTKCKACASWNPAMALEGLAGADAVPWTAIVVFGCRSCGPPPDSCPRDATCTRPTVPDASDRNVVRWRGGSIEGPRSAPFYELLFPSEQRLLLIDHPERDAQERCNYRHQYRGEKPFQ
jgi:hypothetical protein